MFYQSSKQGKDAAKPLCRDYGHKFITQCNGMRPIILRYDLFLVRLLPVVNDNHDNPTFTLLGGGPIKGVVVLSLI